MNRLSTHLIAVILAFVGCAGTPKERIVMTAVNTESGLKAELIEIKGSGLFSDKEFLQISNISDSTSYRVTRDLLDGQGGYEGGIAQLKWVDRDKLYIDRAIADSPAGLIFSVSAVQFEKAGDSLSTLFRKK